MSTDLIDETLFDSKAVNSFASLEAPKKVLKLKSSPIKSSFMLESKYLARLVLYEWANPGLFIFIFVISKCSTEIKKKEAIRIQTRIIRVGS